MKIHYYGHATIGLTVGGKHLLFDPFISDNPKASHIHVNEIPADYILISHGHGDHIGDVQKIAERTGATLISNFEIISWFGKKGLKKGHPLNHGGQWNFDFGKVQYVNAVHTSSMPDGSNGGNPGGFVVQSEDCCFYYSGDTALTFDMKIIPLRYKLDFAILCIGDNFTMGIEDACIAADFIECDQIIGMHYDTFGYIEIDHQKAIDHFASKGKTLHLIDVGGNIEI